MVKAKDALIGLGLAAAAIAGGWFLLKKSQEGTGSAFENIFMAGDAAGYILPGEAAQIAVQDILNGANLAGINPDTGENVPRVQYEVAVGSNIPTLQANAPVPPKSVESYTLDYVFAHYSDAPFGLPAGVALGQLWQYDAAGVVSGKYAGWSQPSIVNAISALRGF